MNQLFRLLSAICLIFLPLTAGLISCVKSTDPEKQVPLVTTANITGITARTAISGGNVTEDYDKHVTVRGVCWSQAPNPTVNDNKTTDGSGSGTYVSTLTGLEPGTQYNVCAYAVNAAGVSYGAVMSFTTNSVNPNINFNSSLTYGTVADNEGNSYQTIQIEAKTWMAENLRTNKLNDGTPVAYVTGNPEWAALTTPGYCWPDNDIGYKDVYGALYNWHAVNTGKLCPAGWHIPTDAEWTDLETVLGGASIAAGKMKAEGTTHWINPNSGATNESGFTALPGG